MPLHPSHVRHWGPQRHPHTHVFAKQCFFEHCSRRRIAETGRKSHDKFREHLLLVTRSMYISHALSSQIPPYVHNARMRIYHAANVQQDAVVALSFQMPLNDPFLSTYSGHDARVLCPIADTKRLDMRPAPLNSFIPSRSR